MPEAAPIGYQALTFPYVRAPDTVRRRQFATGGVSAGPVVATAIDLAAGDEGRSWTTW